MAIASQVTVTTTATRLIAGVNTETRYALINSTGDLYVGGDNGVTTSNGYLLEKSKAGQSQITIHPNEELWAIVSTGTHTVYVLITEI